MDPKKKKTLLAAGVAFVALAGLTAGAVQADGRWSGRDGHHFRGHHHHMMGGKMGMMGMMGHLSDLADADKDGKLTQQEIDAAIDERFAKYDADGDGKLSLDEFENLLREIMRPMTVRAFQRLDPDGDAAITREELGKPVAGIVERLDRDGDGALSRGDRSRGHGWSRDGDRSERMKRYEHMKKKGEERRERSETND